MQYVSWLAASVQIAKCFGEYFRANGGFDRCLLGFFSKYLFQDFGTSLARWLYAPRFEPE
jgi:hypothetical protein